MKKERVERSKMADTTAMFDWKQHERGRIESKVVSLEVKENLEDLAQVEAKLLHLKVEGSVTVQQNTLFRSGLLAGQVNVDFIVRGEVDIKKFKHFSVKRDFITEKTGSVFTSRGGHVIVTRDFNNKNTWCVQAGCLRCEVGWLRQSEDGKVADEDGAEVCFDIKHCIEEGFNGQVTSQRLMFVIWDDVICDAKLQVG